MTKKAQTRRRFLKQAAALAAVPLVLPRHALAASGEPAPFPCGACRQVLAEFCTPDLPIHIADGGGIRTLTLGGLLPHGFTFGAPHD